MTRTPRWGYSPPNGSSSLPDGGGGTQIESAPRRPARPRPPVGPWPPVGRRSLLGRLGHLAQLLLEVADLVAQARRELEVQVGGRLRPEERRVGKEWGSRWWPDGWEEKSRGWVRRETAA